MQEVTERTTAYLTVQFKDKDGALAAPSGITYRIDCLTTGNQVKDDTAVSAASSVEIEIGAADNAMQSAGNAREVRRVTVKASYGADDELNDEYDYVVKNLSGL